MVIIPRSKPVVENLNSYYVNIRKLFEHYQAKLDAGGVYFKSSLGEGAIFFNKESLLGGGFQGEDTQLSGEDAVDFILNGMKENTFIISVYDVKPETVYFWATLSLGKTIYRDLSTEFTDLEGLITKMKSERLTGYIEVFISDGEFGAFIFFQNGGIIGGSYSWEPGGPNESGKNLKLLIEKTRQSSGGFHVTRVPGNSQKQGGNEFSSEEMYRESLIQALEHLLVNFEKIFSSGRKNKSNFSILLKKKFVDMAERFEFLDPFAGEFEYSNRRISFAEDIDDQELLRGIVTAVAELSGSLGLFPKIKGEISTVLNKYEKK